VTFDFIFTHDSIMKADHLFTSSRSGKRSGRHSAIRLPLLLAVLLLLSGSLQARTWWNDAWGDRVKFTVDTTDNGVPVSDPIGTATVVVRLHDGNFNFDAAKEDGSDLRFVTGDDKTLLASQIEKFDPVMNEGFVWVKIPDLKPGATTDIYLYYNRNEKKKPKAGEKTDLPKSAYDGDTVTVYHFNEHGTPPGDSSGEGNNAETPGIPVEGSIIGSGIKLDGKKPIIIPAAPTSAILEAAPYTWMAWVKPTTLTPNTPIYSRKDGANALRIGLDSGVPFLEITSAAGTQHSAPTTPLGAGTWHHLAVVSDGTRTTLYVDGAAVANLPVALPSLNAQAFIGGDGEGKPGFFGEMDEMEVSKAARTPGFIKLAALGQGEQNAKLLANGKEEAGAVSILDKLGIFGFLIRSVTLDAWLVIGILGIMSAISWIVMVAKFSYIKGLSRGSKEFINEWHHLAGNITALDTSDPEKIASLGGRADPVHIQFIHSSPIYRVYHLGCQEIQKRGGRGGGLSRRSIEAIKSSIDGQATRETVRLNSSMVLLTICIAGGPYVGLLGTIIGVMITFGEIAMLGEVDINAIAPGIAAALLATVCGLIVAIPALFGYNYLSVQVKEITTDLHLFIEEFITRMAERHEEPDPAETSR
jgi:biopolymer transport protein ExbB